MEKSGVGLMTLDLSYTGADGGLRLQVREGPMG